MYFFSTETMTQLALKDDKSTEVISKNHEKKIQRKQRRFQHMITNDAGVICCDQPTKVKLDFFKEILRKIH